MGVGQRGGAGPLSKVVMCQSRSEGEAGDGEVGSRAAGFRAWLGCRTLPGLPFLRFHFLKRGPVV